jgi:hypothetical protein
MWNNFLSRKKALCIHIRDAHYQYTYDGLKLEGNYVSWC